MAKITPAKLLGEPKHLAQILFYEISFDYRIYEHRAIYYKDLVRWDDHPWGQNGNTGGMDFVNQWTLESRCAGQEQWSSEGRSNGWDSLKFEDWELDYALTLKRSIGFANLHLTSLRRQKQETEEQIQWLQKLEDSIQLGRN